MVERVYFCRNVAVVRLRTAGRYEDGNALPVVKLRAVVEQLELLAWVLQLRLVRCAFRNSDGLKMKCIVLDELAPTSCSDISFAFPSLESVFARPTEITLTLTRFPVFFSRKVFMGAEPSEYLTRFSSDA